MKTSHVFETFNDFLVNKETAQILELCDNIEVFSSETLGFGNIYNGEKAPEVFRAAINEYSRSRKSKTLQLESFVETGSGGLFCVNVVSGRVSKLSVFSTVIKDKKLVSFVETSN